MLTLQAAEFEGTHQSHKHYYALDGLRAIALLSVLVHHYAPALLGGTSTFRRAVLLGLDMGGLGVDLFFALSGFLITGILYDSKGRSDYFSRFYWRRSLRIFPAYYGFLLPCCFVPVLFRNVGPQWFLFYLRNWLGPDIASDRLLGHLWSLAVEEQFYIGWAIAIYMIGRKYIPWSIVLLSVTAFLFRGWMYVHGYSSYEIIRFTFSRMDGLLLGGLVAIAVRNWNERSVKKTAYLLGIIALLMLCTLLFYREALAGSMWIYFSTGSAIFFASVVALGTYTQPHSAVGRVLGWNFLRSIAKYSYAMYLVHLLPHVIALRGLHWAASRISQPLFLILKAAYVPVLVLVVYCLARLSWKFIEEPCLRWKERTPADLIPGKL